MLTCGLKHWLERQLFRKLAELPNAAGLERKRLATGDAGGKV